MKKTLLAVVLSLLGAFLLIQLVPYRVSNPSLRQEPKWDSPQTRALAVAACFDCHSNEVKTPWYGKIAPISWLITQHVDDGRASLNLSDWNGKRGEGAGDAAETVRDGSMPPTYYTWFGLHGSSKLTKTQRDQLAHGLTVTLSRR
jgi:hypothetical protein